MNKTALFAAMVSILISASTVQATDYTWNGTADNNWSNTANWVGNTLPPEGTYGVIGPDNRIIIQHGTYDPTNNVPTFDVETATPKFVIEAGASLFTEMARDAGEYGPIGTGTIVSVGNGGTLTWGRTGGSESLMEFCRSVDGIQTYNITNGTFAVTNCNRLDWSYNQNRISRFNINGGSFVFYGSSMFGTRWGTDSNAVWALGASLVNLTNGASFIAPSAHFEGNMKQVANDQPNLVFDLQSLSSRIEFTSGGSFTSISAIETNGIGSHFISSTYGEEQMICTQDNGFTVKFGYYIWEGGSDTDWTNTANWVDGYLPPVSAHNAIKDSKQGNPSRDLIVISSSGGHNPELNVPYLSYYSEAYSPKITIKDGATLAISDSTALDGPCGLYTYTVEAGGTFVWKSIRAQNKLVLARDPSGDVNLNVSGTLTFDSSVKILKFGNDYTRHSIWDIDGGTVSFQTNTTLHGTSNISTNDFTYPSTIALRNGGRFNASPCIFEDAMEDNNANPTLVFDIQDISSSMTFKHGGIFNSKSDVTGAISKNFISSTMGDSLLKVTDNGTTFTISAPAPGTVMLVR